MHLMLLIQFCSSCVIIIADGLTCSNGGFNPVPPQSIQECMYQCHCMKDGPCDSYTGNCSGNCAAGWMGPGCQYGDIAYHKTTKQKSTRSGYPGPDKAVDGDFSTCSQTMWQNDPWWRVDLDATYIISGLIIRSGETDALKGFEVRVGNVSSDTPSAYPRTCFKHNITDELDGVFYVVCALEQVGQHLMIQVPASNTRINLCDVRVYGGRSLAYRRNATQISGFKDASLAVDGRTSTQFHDGTCTHTFDEMSPWWRVDLVQVYTIIRMEIFNRQDCCAERLSGFSISFAVNDSYTLVYKYPNTTPSEKTEVTNISSTTARFMEIALPDVKYGPLTLCEVFIYGECPDNLCGWSCESPCFCAGPIDKRNKIDGICPGGCAENWTGNKCNSCRPGRFGVNCDQQCGKCAMDGSCNRNTGKCIYGCLPGWTNDNCSIVCPLRWFGQNCSQQCGHCVNDSSCNHVNGTCTNGCSPGYNGSLCNTVCPLRWFGQNCSQQCGHCVNDSSCHHVNGICAGGCSPGYNGSLCNTVCPLRWFGQNCSQQCGHCVNDSSCHHVNGTCAGGCSPGYNGSLCNTVCPLRWFGQNCSQQCGHCVNDSSCHHVNGTCAGGCSPGYNGSLFCPLRWFGQNCSQQCGHCVNDSSCHHVNGTCADGCSPGYNGSLCNTVCPLRWFGQNCSQECGHCFNGSSCHHIIGTCADGCSPGYNESLCNTVCPLRWFGQNCSQQCGHCVNDSSCHHVNGTCAGGCSPGYNGSLCNTVLETRGKDNDSEMTMASIGGAVGGAISALVLILIATGLVLWKRRRLSSAKQQQEHRVRAKKANSDDISNTYENAWILNQDTMIDVRPPVSNLTDQEPENRINIAFKTTEKAKENKTMLGLAGIGEQVHSSTEETLHETFADISSKESEIETCDNHGVYYNFDQKRIHVENLADYVKKGVYLSTNIEQEYESLISGPQYDTNVALQPPNRPKNRYKGIYAYDKTRVVLDPLPEEPDSDYINACFINGYKRDKAYIAAQGPTTTIVNDFWRMIWQYNIKKIVMLTELYEQGKQKCHQYWPSTGAMKFGTIQVEIIDEDVCTEYTIRFLKITRMGYREQNLVTQFHFTAWPDRDVPDSPAALVQFWNKVRHTNTPSDSQTLVHCSAGIGRTGTYIALDYLYDEGLTAGSIHIFDCINDLRRQRVGMVQNAEQYVYLHKALQEALVSSGKRVDVNDFPRYYQEMQGIDLKKRQRKLLVEFESLRKEELCCPEKRKPESTKDTNYGYGDEYACAKLPENKEKNRYDNIVPSRKSRPFLSSYVSGCNDYINAVCLPTRKNKNGLLLTQIPLPDTVVDFWRLVFEYDVHTLVMLNEEHVPGEKIGVYWPKGDQVCQLGPFTVKTVSEIKKSTHLERTLHICKQGQENSMKVTQFVCSVWKSKGMIPDSCSQFLSFLEEVDSWQRQSNNRPIIPHCLNGAERSGLFCVLWCVLDKVKADREVAIQSVVRLMQIRRQQIVPNFEQYQFCHDIVLEYLTNFVTYTNI